MNIEELNELMAKSSRRQSREIALQVLYQIELSELQPEEALRLHYDSFESAVEAREFAEQLVLGISAEREAIDRLIDDASQNWSLSRMAPVDRNILRIALYEMQYCEHIPPKASINEAIELAKKYGTEDSGAFVNGILDQVYRHTHKSAPPDPAATPR